MQENIFDLYQRKGLIEAIGSDDNNYNSLMKAADEIAKKLQKSPSKIINYALVAIDNQVSEEEPILAEVETVIQSHWKMVRSHFMKMPIALYRCIILQSLQNIEKEDECFANIVYLSLIDVYPYLEITKAEKDILQQFLQYYGDLAEDIAVSEWTVDKEDINITIPSLKANTKNTTTKIKEEEFRAGINATAIRSTSYSNDVLSTSWIPTFYDKATPYLVGVLNNIIDNVNTTNVYIQKDLTTFYADLAKILKVALNETVQSTIAVERRSQLLWWKETLYSRKLHKSYRKLNKFESVIAMAVDLYEMLPTIYPVSVDYILREAFNKIHGFQENEISFGDFITWVNDSKNQAFLKIYFPKGNEQDYRMDLVSFMEKVIHNKMDIDSELIKCIGITPDKKMAYEDIAVWILHCLTIKHLT